MEERIKEIRAALNEGLYYVALSLSLTLPDVCGKNEFQNKKSSRSAYIDWFNKYAKKHFTCNATVLSGGEEVPYIWFTGEECYALRCAFLHAGNFEVEKVVLSKVRLHAHIKNGIYYSHMCRDNSYADWDVTEICKNICNAVEEYCQVQSNLMLNDIRIDIW